MTRQLPGPVRCAALMGLLGAGIAQADPAVSGRIAAEGRGYLHAPRMDGQDRHGAAVWAQAEYRTRWNRGFQFVLVPFLRADTGYDDAVRPDLRECSLRYREENWQVRAGIGQVAWGASDVIRLVDVVNTPDRPDLRDGTERLGQPMVEFAVEPGVGVFTLYLLPYFREMPFPDRRERLRPNRPVDTHRPLYESGSASDTVDLALRFSHTAGTLDLGIHLFLGRNRVPLLIPSERIPAVVREPDPDAAPSFVPFYENIVQAGIDLQWARGGWLWKVEALHREGFFERHAAAVGGFEFTFSGLAAGPADLSLVAEYAYDQRGKSETSQTVFDNDLFLGFRLAAGDFAGSEIQGGVMVDLDSGETLATARAGRRFGSAHRLELEAWFLLASPEDSLLYPLRRDDFVRLRWVTHW